jgi:hypothetical protein
MIGAAALLPLTHWWDGGAATSLAWMVGGAAAAHLLMVLGEITQPHATAHTHLAVTEMVRRSYAPFFWTGVACVAVAVAAPWIGVVAVPFALLGLLAHEHAYVQAAQAVPLA